MLATTTLFITPDTNSHSLPLIKLTNECYRTIKMYHKHHRFISTRSRYCRMASNLIQ